MATEMEIFFKQVAREKPQRFSPNQINKMTCDFSVLIGSGRYGEVYRGVLPDGSQLAVKILEEQQSNMATQFMEEVSAAMEMTPYRNILKLYGYCFDTTIKALVFEYMDSGSFNKILYENHMSLGWSELYDIAIGIAKGISYLHESCGKQIIHLDVKAANVLIDSNLCPKLVDFGLAVVCDLCVVHFTLTHVRGTREYAAPEVWGSVGVGCKSDAYSFGMLLFEILGRSKIWSESGVNTDVWFPKQVWECFRDSKLEEFISNCQIHPEDRAKAKTLAVVALCCAQHVPENRRSMSTVVKILEGAIQVTEPPNPFPYVVTKDGVLPIPWSPVSLEASPALQTRGAQTAATSSDISQERTKREYYGPPPEYKRRKEIYIPPNYIPSTRLTHRYQYPRLDLMECMLNFLHME